MMNTIITPVAALRPSGLVAGSAGMSWPGGVGTAAHVELPPVSQNDRTFRPAVVGAAKQARPPRGVPR